MKHTSLIIYAFLSVAFIYKANATVLLDDDFSQPNYNKPYDVYHCNVWDGAPNGGGLLPNYGTTPGHTVLGADLPGGSWLSGGVTGWDYDAIEVGNLPKSGASNIELTGGTTDVPYLSLHNNANVAISLKGYHTNALLSVSVYVYPKSNDCYVGFDSATHAAGSFTGLRVDRSGGISLFVQGYQIGGTIAFTGAWVNTTARLLTFTVNTSTGAISNIWLQGSTSTYNFNTTAFSGSATNYAALSTPSGAYAIFAYLEITSTSLTQATTGGGNVAAVSADAFLNSIGVCTHMTQGVDTESNVASCLTYAGIRNIRDNGSISATTLQKFINLHGSSGTKVSLLPPDFTIADCLTEYETLAASGALLAAEGPNEPNNWPVTYNGQTSSSTTALPTAQFQAALYSAVKGDSKLAGIPVFASSEAGGSEPNNVGLQFLTIPGSSGVTLMPTGTAYADYANTHNYLVANGMTAPVDNTAWGAEDPTLDSQWDGLYHEYGHTWWSSGYNGYTAAQLPNVPRVTTETGWYTSANSAIGESNPVSQDQQGKLFLNLYLSAFKEGWSYTFVYYLHDTTNQGYWGLFDTNYNPKLSGTYLHNLTTILADTTSFSPDSLNYSIPNEPATVHDLLIQKSNGTFYLAVWDDRPVGTGTDSVTVNLGGTYAVSEYDPTIGTTATNVGTVNSVTLSLSDHPLILAIP